MLSMLIVKLLLTAVAIIKHGYLFGLLAGLAILAFNAEDGGVLKPFLLALATFSALPFLAMQAAPILASKASLEISISPLDSGLYFVAMFIAVVGVFGWLRHGVHGLEIAKKKLTKTSRLERNKRTDVREIHKFLPDEIPAYNPASYFSSASKHGIFLGLDEKEAPLRFDYETWKISHILLTGRTRAGKGVAAQILLSQAIAAGEYVVILDPKVDAWMPHIFKAACDQSGLPYRFLDLRQSAPPQTNIFKNCDAETIENMLIGGFGLTEKGEAADFYRLADRKAARQCAVWLAAHPEATARDALAANGDAWAEAAPAFMAYLAEIAELPALNHKGGLDIAAGEQEGGCLYVVGDMINPRLLRAQKMILLRLLFLAKNRDQTMQNRTITVMADEFKVHISRPFMISLGASAGWGLHCILAFQSLQDLSDCPADLDAESVKGSVMENCAVQISYAIKDPDTAEWLSKSTGTVLVDDEIRKIEKNIVLSETFEDERSVRMAERYYIDTNMFMNLPKACGVLSIPGSLARFCYTSPVRAERTQAAITPEPLATATAEANIPEAAPPVSVGAGLVDV
ncbi:MAG: type IV secretory system conjugative DNA transfer family protein [Rhodocyclaceae bacterium]|nr:type IV secretory system conjugative DNA transfer family protein [Rhodocyclaceae bacterium]